NCTIGEQMKRRRLQPTMRPFGPWPAVELRVVSHLGAALQALAVHVADPGHGPIDSPLILRRVEVLPGDDGKARRPTGRRLLFTHADAAVFLLRGGEILEHRRSGVAHSMTRKR